MVNAGKGKRPFRSVLFSRYGRCSRRRTEKMLLMKKQLFAGLLFLIHQSSFSQMPLIHSVVVSDEPVEKNGKFEAGPDLSAVFENPYDYDQIAVSARFTSPEGVTKTADGFFMQEYDLDPADGTLTPVGGGRFKVRFSPDREGVWAYRISVKDANGTMQTGQMTFTCTASKNSANKGFVRSGQSNYLRFDDGGQFIPVGENMAWHNDDAFEDYRNWLTALKENGGNFFRLWHAHWGLGIEWRSGWRNFGGLRRYQQMNCRYQDWLFDFCAENGIYVMLCLQHHGQVSSRVNPNWTDNPYNAANGGPCLHPPDFFTSEEALAHTRNRLRYIVARWGYSRSIIAWELFNEVDLADDYTDRRAEVAGWHFDMAAYLKALDPNEHLVTTSYAYADQDPVVWASPDIDFTQTHFYLNTSNIERSLVSGVRRYLDDYGKPSLSGEFGLGSHPGLSNADVDGIHLHNSLWGVLFGGGLGSAMTWWWDSYVHPKDLYYHFAPLSAVAAEMPFLEGNMAPAYAFVFGAPGDLMLTPTLGWGIIGDDAIHIEENGRMAPANPGLGIFLYGSLWNTQYRSPPTFSVYYPMEGEFAVKTGMESGFSPRIAIYLDSELVLDEAAGVNTSYSVAVPAGRHEIRVDNPGTDWITIASYIFAGAGSEVDPYVLLSENRDMAAGWVLNHRYNHQFLGEYGVPDPVVSGQLVVEEVQDGPYSVFWYDCLTGALVSADGAFASGGRLEISLPDLHWDLAFLALSDPLGTSVAEEKLAFEVYPNPVVPGGRLTLSNFKGGEKGGFVALMDASGRALDRYRLTGFSGKGQDLQFNLPRELSAGLYWIRLEIEGKTGSRLLTVVRR